MENTFYIGINPISCYPTILDVRKYIKILFDNGYKEVSDPSRASLILIFTCAVTRLAEDQSIKLIRKKLSIKNNCAQLVVCGCLAKTHRNWLEKEFSLPLFAPQEEKDFTDFLKLRYNQDDKESSSADGIQALHGFIKLRGFLCLLIKNLSFILEKINKGCGQKLKRLHNTMRIYDKKTYVIRISEGCNCFCSYCIIKKARGSIKSRLISNIVKEIQMRFNNGFNHFMLVCDDFASYGLDIGEDFILLLNAIFKIDKKITVSLCNVGPQHFLRRLEDFLGLIEPGRISTIEYTVQHGSNRVLEKMARNYTIEDYVKSIQTIKARDPQITFKTHIMIGFPGENESDFRKSLILIDKVMFDRLSIFKYADRPGTVSSNLPEKVPFNIQQKWHRALLTKYRLKMLWYWITGNYNETA